MQRLLRFFPSFLRPNNSPSCLDRYHAKKSSSDDYCAPLEQIRWWRIIYDEGHSLKESSSSKYHACADLVSVHKWIVSGRFLFSFSDIVFSQYVEFLMSTLRTGTPVSSTLLNLKAQLKLLGIDSVDEMFRAVPALMATPRRGSYNHVDSEGMANLYFLMRGLMMRHSQKQKYRGTSTTLMSLPPKVRSQTYPLFEASKSLCQPIYIFYILDRTDCRDFVLRRRVTSLPKA